MDNSKPSADRCPVVNFDHSSAEHAAQWPAEFQHMRQSCPRAWTHSHGGYWVATKYKDIVEIAQAPEEFTSGKHFDPDTGVASGGIVIPAPPLPAYIPDETDNPQWTAYRRFLNPRFGPKAAEEFRTFAEGVARSLIDRVIESGTLDIVEDLTSPLPAIVTMKLFGFDLKEWQDFADPIHKHVYTLPGDPEHARAIAGIEKIQQQVIALAAQRRIDPRDDLLSYIATGRIDGRLMNELEIAQMAGNIIGGGVDTTTGLTAHTLRYLSQNPAQRQLLIDDPAALPRAREEFVRYFTPVHSLARNAARDVELAGWQFRKGDRVLLAYASANRDEEIFENPEEVRLDRFPNRHIAFGAGMHRCLGSFFARMMFESMVREVLARIPDYAVIDSRARPYPSIVLFNGWISMPATFTAGRKLGGGVEI